MTATAAEKRIDLTGWSTLLLGIVCIGVSALQAVLPVLLKRLADAVGEADDGLASVRAAWSTGSGVGAVVVNGVFGAALVAIGIGVVRRRPWAHPALTACCWVSIAVLVVLAKPTLEPFVALLGDGAAAGPLMLVAGAALLVAQIAAVLWFLRFWRRPEVRAAFR